MQQLDHKRLAEGEATGHYHEVIGETANLYVDAAGNMQLQAPDGAEVRHQEHGPVQLPPATYTREIVREYDHFAEEAREAVD